MSGKNVHDEAIDVAATIAALRAHAVARARAMGVTDEALADDPLRRAADLAHISAHLPIMWRVPLVGRALAYAQRATRIALRWYINPIVDQINDFNEATITALNAIAARQEALAVRIAALEAPTPPAPLPMREGGDVGAHSRAPSGQDATDTVASRRESPSPDAPLPHREGPGVGASS